MAQYRVTYRCGHVVTEQLYGPSSQREGRLKWAAGVLCPTCRREAELQRAQAETADLPPLVGTPKQVAWATVIRSRAMEAIAEVGRKCSTNEDQALFAAYRERLVAQTDAAWWIERRDKSALDYLREVRN